MLPPIAFEETFNAVPVSPAFPPVNERFNKLPVNAVPAEESDKALPDVNESAVMLAALVVVPVYV